MNDTSIIQQARDALAKWKDGHETTWTFDANGIVTDDIGYVRARTGADARLIVGTAGNPELLDVLNEFLSECDRSLRFWESLDKAPGDQRVAITFARNMSRAIIAAEERMSTTNT